VRDDRTGVGGIDAGIEAQVSGYPLRLDRFYDPDTHMWVQTRADGLLRIGLDALTADTYGSLAQLMITPSGTAVERGDPFGSLEAAKFVGPLTAPLSGVVKQVNAAVLEDPGLVLREPYDGGWLVDLDPSELDHEGDVLVGDEAAHAWFTQAVAHHRAKGLVAE
jgi:glycine cleavage system H protein